jgi:hypothetical protein
MNAIDHHVELTMRMENLLHASVLAFFFKRFVHL